ncbi:MAG: type II toxin-antitoxin system RelE/ParE family toxin [Myxococcales bacterium]
MLRARFFRTASGAIPVRDWLLSLPKEVRREIGADIAGVQWQWPTGKPLVDGFGDGLYEVRTAHVGQQYRVLFYVESGTLVLLHADTAKGTMVLVHGIHKKTQRTPTAAIALARKRMKEGT